MNLYDYRESLLRARLLRSLALNLIVAILVFTLAPRNFYTVFLYEIFLLRTFYLSVSRLNYFDVLSLAVNSLCINLVVSIYTYYVDTFVWGAIIYNLLNFIYHWQIIKYYDGVPDFTDNTPLLKYTIQRYVYAWYMDRVANVNYNVYHTRRSRDIHANRLYYVFVVDLDEEIYSDIDHIHIAGNNARAIKKTKSGKKSLEEYFYPIPETFSIFYTKDNDDIRSTLRLNNGYDFSSILLQKNKQGNCYQLIIHAHIVSDFVNSLKILDLLLTNESTFEIKPLKEEDF